MNNVLVLGIGNPLLGDDGFGVEVVRRLRERNRTTAVEFLDGGSLGLGLLPYLEGRSHILVVDAIDFGGRPGEVVRLGAAEIPAYGGLKLSEHQVPFREVLGLMDMLGVKPRELRIVGVQPRSTDWGAPLSSEVEAAIPVVLEEIERQIAQWEKEE
jgi:hydrogenase maturation protease